MVIFILGLAWNELIHDTLATGSKCRTIQMHAPHLQNGAKGWPFADTIVLTLARLKKKRKL